MSTAKQIDLSALSEFGAKFLKDANSYVDGLKINRDVQKMDAFVKKLF